MTSILDAVSQGALLDPRCDQARLEILPGKTRIIQGLRLPYSKSVMILSKLHYALLKVLSHLRLLQIATDKN